jgi:hypothetical protein
VTAALVFVGRHRQSKGQSGIAASLLSKLLLFMRNSPVGRHAEWLEEEQADLLVVELQLGIRPYLHRERPGQILAARPGSLANSGKDAFSTASTRRTATH